MSEKYFLIGTDESYRPLPRILDFRDGVKIEYLKAHISHEQKKTSVVHTEYSFSGATIYPDIFDIGIFMVSNNIYEILEMYEPGLIIKRVNLIEQRTYKTYEYVIPILKEVDCLSDRTTYKQGRCIDRGCLVEDKIPDLAVFKIADIDGISTVARLDFVESLLKRSVRGIYLQDLETS